MNYYADIHCHPTLHPYAFNWSGKKRNNSVWSYDPPNDRQRDSPYPEFTQADFRTLALANVKMIYASLYPIEQGWFKAIIFNEGGVTDILAKIISRLPVKFINHCQGNDLDYFDALKEEYQFLADENEKPHSVKGQSWKFKLVRNNIDLANIMNEDCTIGVIITIEGVQSLISGNQETIDNATFDHKKTIENIIEAKNWKYPPFFISLTHHFYSGYCGHARSFPKPASTLLDQTVGLNQPINLKGNEIIDCMLGINGFEGNGRRILVDTKHMSAASKIEYYAKIKAFNEGKENEEKIPIVASHAGYSENHSISGSMDWPDTDESKYDASSTFNPWSINLSDEEIIEIFNSRGIIGINFDQRILSGAGVIEDFDKKFKKKDFKRNITSVRRFWGKQMLENILAIANAVYASNEIPPEDKVKIWDMIALGTDFDGMINPIDAFITAEDFKELENTLVNLLKQHDNGGSVLKGLDLEHITRRIMFDNAYEFALRHYN